MYIPVVSASTGTLSVQFEGDTNMELDFEEETVVMTLSTDTAQWDATLVIANLTQLDVTGTNAEIEAEVHFKLLEEFNGVAEVLDVNNGDELYYFEYSAEFSESNSSSQLITTLFRADNAEEDSHLSFHNVAEELVEISAQLGTSFAFDFNVYGSLLEQGSSDSYSSSYYGSSSDSGSSGYYKEYYNGSSTYYRADWNHIDLSVMLFDDWMTFDGLFAQNFTGGYEWTNLTVHTTLVNLTAGGSLGLENFGSYEYAEETVGNLTYAYNPDDSETTASVSLYLFDLYDDLFEG